MIVDDAKRCDVRGALAAADRFGRFTYPDQPELCDMAAALRVLAHAYRRIEAAL